MGIRGNLMATKSILQGTEKKCYLTGRTDRLHLHHVFGGIANRKISDKNGFVVWLIPELHNMSKDGVHFNRELDLKLKRECQAAYEASGHSREEFIKLIGRNYL